ncbi:SdrD B-like domain-containing protein [Conexibacter woesei]|uniref:SD-repeat containing protein B domain-containing protein n=1 Tax=Conexibacter woesei (strain DSM 14684 / CCUG 47730 / CIP 108061 / JCM 11494 / NBRC 100937 / ID131577) TaxID=469383 RepID=D3F6H6_CONWI|nr:SdrD B-like domain-containing protein [Conexibacter woesei]ADB50743.1 hypothetical protein Cwoe_2319 [Conexibacter woesei DSM 14684]
MSAPVAAVAVVFACALPAGAATVSGSVFNDYDTNGLRDTDPDSGAVDVGVGGLTVRALTGTGAVADTATTAADGSYALRAPDGRVRIELTVPSPWQPTRQLNGLRSDEQFVDASSVVRGADFGVHHPHEWSFDAPEVYLPMQWAGPTDARNTGADAIRALSYFTTPLGDAPPGPPPPLWSNQPSRRVLARFGEVGTIFGLGVDQRGGALYAGAYYKRYTGLTPAGAGAIHRVTQGGAVSLWADLQAGADAHPTSRAIDDWTGPAPANRDMQWEPVGKRGLGSVEVDPQNRNVYTVNLFDKQLYRLPLDATPPVRPAAATPIPDPGCQGGEWRPFSVGFDRVSGAAYVGGVCAADASQSTADLRAVVYRVGDPAGSPSFTQVLSVPLAYERIPVGAVSTQFFSSRWQPWPTPASLAAQAPRGATVLTPSDTTRGTRVVNGATTSVQDESYPQLTAISVLGDGSLQLGFRDLMGDMSGNTLSGEGPPSGNGISPTIQGDLLRASPAAGGGFELESGGVVGGVRGFGAGTNYGPIGPRGGYFYDPRPGAAPTSQPTEYQGGLLQLPGFRDVLTTQTDVDISNDNGLLWYDNADGIRTRRLRNYVTQGPNEGFGKANGLGDLDAYSGRAPVQIGNRLWYDVDSDGLQDAGESSVADTVVELLDDSGVVIDNTTTDSSGEYVFAIGPDTPYSVRVPLAQSSLDGWAVTQAFAGSNPRIDSNGVERDGRSVASVAAHPVGHNDHSYDFGFDRPRPPRPPEPPQPPLEPPVEPPLAPPAPPQPQYAGAEPSPNAPMVLVKYLVRRTAGRVTLRRLQFAMVIRNAGPQTVSRVRLCDNLPRLLDVLGATRLARRFPRARQVCWNLASLTSGQARTFNVLTQLRRRVLLGLLVNRARAIAQRVRPAHARAVVRPRSAAPRVTG